MDSTGSLQQQPAVTLYSKLADLQAIGQGGFGRVYKARHEDWGTVAYKELLVRYISHTDRVANELKQEVSVHIKLRHPNVVTMMAMVFEKEHYGVILEFATYGDIFLFLSRYPVDWAWRLSLAYDITLGMNYLHTQPRRPLIHGDLKVKNILVGDGFKAKISDFGLARWKQYSSEVTHSSCPGGTVTHIPPENWKNINCRRTEKYDVYGFGVLFWELLAHPRRPFDNVSSADIKLAVIQGRRPAFSEISSDVPQFMLSSIDECWAQEPDNRPMFNTVKEQLATHMNRCRSNIDAARTKLHQHECQRQQQGPTDLMSTSRVSGVSRPSAISRSHLGGMNFTDDVYVKTSSFGPREVVDDGLTMSFRGSVYQQQQQATGEAATGEAATGDMWYHAAGDRAAEQAADHRVQRAGDPAAVTAADSRYWNTTGLNIGQSVDTNPGPVEVRDEVSRLLAVGADSSRANKCNLLAGALPVYQSAVDVRDSVLVGANCSLSVVTERDSESMDTESDTLTQPSDADLSLSTPLASSHQQQSVDMLTNDESRDK